MKQKLILGINSAWVTASFLNSAYRNLFGFNHCGMDIVSGKVGREVYSSGYGEVLEKGFDAACGNVLVILYKGVYNHIKNRSSDIVLRYFHLEKIFVNPGQKVDKDTKIAIYGSTGKYAGTGAHLHIEADYDCKHVLFSPSLKRGTFLRGTSQGAFKIDSKHNSCFNPAELMHLKKTWPDFQTYAVKYSKTVNLKDYYLPPY